MKNKVSKIALATSLALIASVGMAANKPANQEGAYVGLGLGYGTYITAADIFETNIIKSGVAKQVNGGYLFSVADNVSVGFEGAYTDYPTFQYSITYGAIPLINVQWSISSFNILGVVKYFRGNFNVAGKLGGAVMMNTISTVFFAATKMTLQPMGSLGVGYNFTEHLAVNMDLQYVNNSVNNETNQDGAMKVNPLIGLIGLTYSFGAFS